VPVIGAERAVLARRAAELGGCDQHHVVEARPEVRAESGERLREVCQVARQHPLLLHVRVPATDLREADPQAHVRMDERREQSQRLTHLRRWITALSRPEGAARELALEQFHRRECFLPRRRNRTVGRHFIERLEGLPRQRATLRAAGRPREGPQPQLLEAREGDGGRLSLQAARQPLRDRDGL